MEPSRGQTGKSWIAELFLLLCKCIKGFFGAEIGDTEDQIRIAKLEAQKLELMDALNDLIELHEDELKSPSVKYAMMVLEKARSDDR